MDERDQNIRRFFDEFVKGDEDSPISMKEMVSVPMGLSLLIGNEIYQQIKHVYYHLKKIPHERTQDEFLRLMPENTTIYVFGLPYYRIRQHTEN